jgi:hypothetical protein
LLNIFTFCIVRIVQEEEGAFDGSDSLVVVVLVDVLDQALGGEAFLGQTEDHSFVSFVEEVACYRKKDPASVVVDHDWAEED